MSTPSERAQAAAHTDCIDMTEAAAAYEVALAATDNDKVAAAILASSALLAERLDSLVRLFSTAVYREPIYDDGKPMN